MSNSEAFKAKWAPVLLGVLRLIVGFLFIAHGTQKLFNLPALTIPGKPSPFPVPLASIMGVAGLLELVGGLFIFLGLFTRPVAFILSGLMAVAYFTSHAPGGFWPIVNNGELAVLYCFVFLYMAVAGGGALSLDHSLRRGRRS